VFGGYADDLRNRPSVITVPVGIPSLGVPDGSVRARLRTALTMDEGLYAPFDVTQCERQGDGTGLFATGLKSLFQIQFPMH
jgi:hypothetical protein